MKCLIGYTGFVGSNLLEQQKFDVLINSKNFETMKGQHYDEIICAGVSAVKWLANKDPEADLAKINALLDVLKTVTCDKFTLISTIDVYAKSSGVDEDYDCHQDKNHAYGEHHLYVEDFCKKQFKNVTIIRLPGLFGKNLKKNVIFDLIHGNCLENINVDSSFQYYCLDHLSEDIALAEKNDIKLLNIFTEPISTKEIIEKFFSDKELKDLGKSKGPEAHYDMLTKHSGLRNSTGKYLYTKEEVLRDLEKFTNNARLEASYIQYLMEAHG